MEGLVVGSVHGHRVPLGRGDAIVLERDGLHQLELARSFGFNVGHDASLHLGARPEQPNQGPLQLRWIWQPSRLWQDP